MSIQHSIYVQAHRNIYSGNSDREMRIDYALPQGGTNGRTGFLLFVPGFGAHIDSNVYRKMREVFADQYNMVTIQCEYFGSQFMQASQSVRLNGSFGDIAHYFNINELKILKHDFSKLFPIFSTKSAILPVIEVQNESEEDFAEMGFMQAIDVITALEHVKQILIENSWEFDEKNVIGFGQSHGAYLLHLCNRLAPHLFSDIVDNSAWVYPNYLTNYRVLYTPLGNSKMQVAFDYFAMKYTKDKEALRLNNLYANFKNGAYIYSFLGNTDALVDAYEKSYVLDELDFADHQLIDNSKVDGIMFKSTSHGLSADFLELVNYIFANRKHHINPNEKVESYEIVSSNTTIEVSYKEKVPTFTLSNH